MPARRRRRRRRSSTASAGSGSTGTARRSASSSGRRATPRWRPRCSPAAPPTAAGDPEEIEAFREQAKAEGRPPLFRSPWRDADPATAPDAPFVVRLKAPREGETVVEDIVQGTVTWRNETLDDLVLLRSDSTPTYMLAVVVDDHDMGITHVIRGDDHLTNTARQTLIYRGMGWETPRFAHIPLIHGPDGAKLSKRHGALGIEAYRDMGYPAEAMRNYLARLGWSHGNDEFFTTAQAVEWFDLTHLGKAPAQFDFAKLENLSGQHIRAAQDAALLAEIEAFLAAQNGPPLTEAERRQMLQAMPGLKERAKTIPQIIDMASFILGKRPIRPEAAGAKVLAGMPGDMLEKLTSRLQHARWEADDLEGRPRLLRSGGGGSRQDRPAARAGLELSPDAGDVVRREHRRRPRRGNPRAERLSERLRPSRLGLAQLHGRRDELEPPGDSVSVLAPAHRSSTVRAGLRSWRRAPAPGRPRPRGRCRDPEACGRSRGGSGCSARSSTSSTPALALSAARAPAPVDQEGHYTVSDMHVGVSEPPGEHLSIVAPALSAPHVAQGSSRAEGRRRTPFQIGAPGRPRDEARPGERVEAEPARGPIGRAGRGSGAMSSGTWPAQDG